MDHPAQPHLHASGVHKSFDTGDGRIHVVDDVTLEVAHGEFISLLGPSGCGKSTLLRLVAGLVEPDSGIITIDGMTPEAAQADREIGYVLQEPALLPWRTVAANIRLPLDVDRRPKSLLPWWEKVRMRGSRSNIFTLTSILSRQGRGGHNEPTPERRPEVDDLLTMVGLDGFADYYPHQLSGGMQQRTALARAIAVGASLFLMDEPFGALDEITRASMRYELLRIWEADRKTVVFVTHSIAEAVALSDRVAVMSARPGRIVSVIDIDLPRPRSSEMEREPDFLAYTSRIHDLLAQRQGI
ncbi:MAG: ABC transporter ATP-binding protein [Dehalococcoidia bacterium]|nr:ABC transporter ATP-binding protein [Dehalococcoidia bacterium]